MSEFSDSARTFLVSLFSHWLDFLKGSGILVALGLFERFVLKRELHFKWYAVFLVALAFFSCFQAWLDQHSSAEARLSEVIRLKESAAGKDHEISALKHVQSTSVAISTKVIPHWQEAAGPQTGPFGPIFAVELVAGFKTLPQCLLRITSASVTTHFKDALRWILTENQTGGAAGCRIWDEPRLPKADSSLVQLNSNRGIIIHWNVSFNDGERAANMLQNFGLLLSASNRMPPDSPSNLIWIDIGPGSPWKLIGTE